MMDIPPLSESSYPFLYLKPEKVRRTPLGQSVRETPRFLNTFSTDEPKVITWWGLQTVKGLKCVIFILNFDYSRHSMVKLVFRGGRYTIGRREKWPGKVGRREKSRRKCREKGENEVLGVGRYR